MDIQERNKDMKTLNGVRLCAVLGTVLCLLMAACGTPRKMGQKIDAPDTVRIQEKPLSAEEQRKFDYFLIEALRLKHQGRFDEAFEAYRHCLDIDPTSAVVHYELALLYGGLKDAPKTEQMLERAVALNPDNFWYQLFLANFYQRYGSTDKAIAIYEQMIKRFPKKTDPLVTLIGLYSDKNDYADAIRVLNRLEVQEGKSEQISMQKFKLYLQMDSTKQAFREIEALVKEYPNDMRYRLVLGEVYLDNKRMDEAYKTFQEVLKEEPDNPQAQMALATYYQQNGQDSLYDSQVDSVLLNRKLDTPTRLDIMRQLIADSEQGGGDTTKIMSLFQKVIPLEHETADLSMLCAQYMIAKGVSESRVKQVLNHILKVEPDNTAARMELLRYAVKADNYAEAVAICKPALQYNPDVLEFYYYLGVSYYKENKTDEALNTFKKAVGQINEKSDQNVVSDLYSILGDLYHEKKRDAEAYAAYDSSLVYNPANINTLNNYAYYLSLERKDLDKAEEMSYKTVKAEPQNATYLDTYAWILFEKERYSEAKIYIDEAIKNDKNPGAAVWEHCGDIYYMNGDVDGAMEYWKKAEAAPDNESKTLKRKIQLRKYIKE